MKKWLSLLLAGLMILTMAVSVFAESPVYSDDCHGHGNNGYYIIPIIDFSKNPNYSPNEDPYRVYCPYCGKCCIIVYEDSDKTIFKGFYCADHGFVTLPQEEKVYCPTCKQEAVKFYDTEGNILFFCTKCEKIVKNDQTPVGKTPYCPYCYQECQKVYSQHDGKFLGYSCKYHGYVTPVYSKPSEAKTYCPYCGKELTPIYDKNGVFQGYYCLTHEYVKPIDLNASVYCPWCRKLCTIKYTTLNGVVYLNYYCPTHGLVKLSDDNSYYFTISLYAGYGGTITMDGKNPVKAGETRTITITPDYGYEIAGVYINGYYYGTNDTIRLESIHRDYSVQVKFRKVDTRKIYTLETKTTGSGSVYAIVNGKNVGAISKLSVSYADVVELRFVPAKGHYSIKSVALNGVSQGAISTLTLKRLTQNVAVSAEFQWNNPYSDVKTHLSAVEYVTEANIMGSPNVHIDTDKFMGTSAVSLRAFAAYLAELSDVNDTLNTVSERLTWAKNAGIITNTDDLTKNVTVRQAAALVEVYVRYLEKTNNITFADLKNVAGAKDVAVAVGFLSSTAYQNNGLITRYDMAEICYHIALLK